MGRLRGSEDGVDVDKVDMNARQRDLFEMLADFFVQVELLVFTRE